MRRMIVVFTVLDLEARRHVRAVARADARVDWKLRAAILRLLGYDPEKGRP